MYQLGIGFKGKDKPLKGSLVTPKGLHGLFYNVLSTLDGDIADWLHAIDGPKPFSLVPYYDNHVLAGIQINTVSRPIAEVLLESWGMCHEEAQTLSLGKQEFLVNDISCVNGTTFHSLTMSHPEKIVGLRFLSPTTFKIKNNFLPLPLPINVFRGPYRVWREHAPESFTIPSDWLEWCEANVFVAEHNIQTAYFQISKDNEPIPGFVGEVWFESKSSSLLYLSLFQALARLTNYSGVGYKTTMGMGACRII